jgi:hypothetical protein
MSDIFERLVHVTQDYKFEGIAESEDALTSALDEARAALVSAQFAGIGGLTTRFPAKIEEHGASGV